MIPEIKLETIFCKPNPIPTERAPTKIVSEDKSIPTDFRPKTNVRATKNSNQDFASIVLVAIE